MDKLIYLFTSVFLSSGRNIISKKCAVFFDDKCSFFLSQTLLFGAATVLLAVFGIKDISTVATITLIYGMIYGVLLILSQWMLTLALKSGVTSVCTVIYSLGFIIPTVSGTFFWHETLTFFNVVGIVVAVIIVLLTVKKSEKGTGEENKSFLPFILVAMTASGGLGIMQKVQQSSSAAQEKTVFLTLAFSVAFLCSLAAFVMCRKKPAMGVRIAIYPVMTGLCFGGANFCNTVLAGKMKSGIFFPLQNVSTILFTTLLGILLFKEKITIKTALILFLGVVVILLFSI